MSWRPIKAITALRNEVQEKWPANRYIGIIGDADHASRVSDHNPDSSGEVHAIDVGIEGLNVKAFLNGVIGDKRVWYVIHDRKIWSRTYGWRTRSYHGSNPHTHHIHVSFRYINKYEDDTSPFFSNVKVDDMPEPKELWNYDGIGVPPNKGSKDWRKKNPNWQADNAMTDMWQYALAGYRQARDAKAYAKQTLAAIRGVDVSEQTIAEEVSKLVLPTLQDVVSEVLSESEGRSAQEVADAVVEAMGERLNADVNEGDLA